VPGAPLPECPVTLVGLGEPRDGHREGHLTDLVHPCFTAFYFADQPGLPAEVAGFARTMARRAVPFKLIPLTRQLGGAGSMPHGWDHTGRLFPMYGAEHGCLYLVRPDGHVLARWRQADVTKAVAAIEHALHP
jgi:3-(3-hydroxy-phenyl)propionate hydroxylase